MDAFIQDHVCAICGDIGTNSLCNHCSLAACKRCRANCCVKIPCSACRKSKNWALRCFVREDLIAFLGKLDGGSHLPHDRGDAPPASTAASMLPSRVVARARPGVIE